MKPIHVLVVHEPHAGLDELCEEIDSAGLRFGWLEHRSSAGLHGLEGPASRGALRAALVDERGSLTFKPRRGEALLVDLVREQFLGCRVLILVADEASHLLAGLEPRGASLRSVRLLPTEDGWRLSSLDASSASSASSGVDRSSSLSNRELARLLRRPYLLPAGS